MTIARGQALDRGVTLHQDEAVVDIKQKNDGFAITTEESECETDYWLLATGDNIDLGEDLNCT